MTSEQPVSQSFPRQWGLVLEGHLWGSESEQWGSLGARTGGPQSTVTVLGVRTRLTVQGVVRPSRSSHVGTTCVFNSSTILPSLALHSWERCLCHFSGVTQPRCHSILAVRPLEKIQGVTVRWTGPCESDVAQIWAQSVLQPC